MQAPGLPGLPRVPRVPGAWEAARASAWAVLASVAAVVWLTCSGRPLPPSPFWRWRCPWVRGLVTLAFAVVWSYWLHRLSHTPPFDNIPFYRMHRLTHHVDDPAHADLIERLSIEFRVYEYAMNIVSGGGAGLLLLPCVRSVLDWRVVLYFAFFYAIVHNIVYQLPGCAAAHAAHHADPLTNLGWSPMDHLLGTYTLEKPEDMRMYLPVIILSALAAAFVERGPALEGVVAYLLSQ